MENFWVWFFLVIGLIIVGREIWPLFGQANSALGFNIKPKNVGRVLLGIVFWILTFILVGPILDSVLPETDFGTAALAVLSIGLSTVMAILAGSFLLFKWIKKGATFLFNKIPGTSKLKLFVIAIIILIVVIIIFM